MPLPNTSPDMSPMPTTVSGSLSASRPSAAGVAAGALPRATGGDAHGLVVVARAASRRERVAQPEPVALGDLVGEVGERGRALVGRHDEVGVVAVVPDHVGRGDDLAVDHVVGHVEQAGDELPVAGGHLRPQRLGVGDPLAPLHDEAALGADGDDHRVLHHLGLHEPEHLGAEVLPAVAPAQPAAGHRPTPQVHALDPGRVHPDLEHRPGQRQVGDDLRVELEGEHRPGAGAGVAVDAPGGRRSSAAWPGSG